MSAASRRDQSPRIAVIGAGFGGIGLGIALKQAGVPTFHIFDRAADIGGVWRENNYPGAACDIPSHLYSFPAAPGREWSRRFAPQADILAYLHSCVREFGLGEHLRLGTEITEAEFDAEAGSWRLRTTSGELVEAEVLVAATGQHSRPSIPDLPGLSSFAGNMFHSARWDHGRDLSGARVGVIGTGASAVQFVPEIAPRVANLTLFQRSAPYLMPKPDRRYRRWHRSMFRRIPASARMARVGFLGFYEFGAWAMTSARALLPGFRAACLAQLRLQVRDPALRAALTPDYQVGCKRILISSRFYPALQRPNVSVVSTSIAEIVPEGVRTADGTLHELDVMIMGTGFSTTDFLAPMRVRGLDGVPLEDAWPDGARAYFGMAVSGFPNMFLLYGPYTNLGSGSAPYMQESQIRYVLDAVRLLSQPDVRYLDVRRAVDDGFEAEMQRRLAGSVWTSGCSNWYVNAVGRVVNNWPGTMREYRRRTRRLDPSDYHLAATATATAPDPAPNHATEPTRG